MSSIFDWSTVAANNTATPPDGWPEGMSPSGVNNSARQGMASVIGANLAVVASGTDTFLCTLNPAPAALVDGMTIQVRFTNANTLTNPTLNPNGLGAGTIKKYGGQALIAGDIPAGLEATLRYVASDTHWELLNPQQEPGGSGVLNVTAGSGLTGGGATSTVTVSVGSATVTNNMLATMAANTIKANPTGAIAAAVDATVAQVTAMLGLGSAAFLTAGTAANNVLKLSGTGFVPTGNLNIGTSASQIVAMGSDAKLPAVDGSKLTNLPTSSGGLTAGTTNTKNPIVGSSTTTTAHGLGATPAFVIAWLECISADQGYSVGDRLALSAIAEPSIAPADDAYIGVYYNATNTVINIGALPLLPDQNHGALIKPTAAKWKAVCVPYKIS